MEHDGKLYEITSGYNLHEDAWHYELSGLSGAPGTGPHLTVAIPDATPAGPFTPRPARDVMVRAGGGVVPWPVLQELIDRLDANGELIDEVRDLSAEATALRLTLSTWSHGGRRFEVNQFHDDDAWSYELYEVDTPSTENTYIDVRIPDASPDSGPFVPMPVSHVTLTMHGRWTLPWPDFRRFLDAIHAAGDLVTVASDEPAPADQP